MKAFAAATTTVTATLDRVRTMLQAGRVAIEIKGVLVQRLPHSMAVVVPCVVLERRKEGVQGVQGLWQQRHPRAVQDGLNAHDSCSRICTAIPLRACLLSVAAASLRICSQNCGDRQILSSSPPAPLSRPSSTLLLSSPSLMLLRTPVPLPMSFGFGFPDSDESDEDDDDDEVEDEEEEESKGGILR